MLEFISTGLVLASGPLWGAYGFVWVGIVAAVVLFFVTVRKSSAQCARCREINRPAAAFCCQCGQRLSKR